MKSATYSNTAVPKEKFAENLTYDKMGNIKNLTRYGLSAKPSTFGMIDNLTLNYNGNQLSTLHITLISLYCCGLKDEQQVSFK